MPDNEQKTEALFLQLVLTFQTAAWQQLGKIKNPMTDRIEKNLEQSRFYIDMLEMIRNKTQGNLSEDEKQFLQKAVSELQINYVAEVEKEQKEEEVEKPKEEEKKEDSEKATEAKPKKEDKKKSKKK